MKGSCLLREVENTNDDDFCIGVAVGLAILVSHI